MPSNSPTVTVCAVSQFADVNVSIPDMAESPHCLRSGVTVTLAVGCEVSTTV